MKVINKKELRELILDGITTEELKEYDYSLITDMSSIFFNSKSLRTIPYLDTSNVTNMKWMFCGCRSLISIPYLDTSNVTDMRSMFENCSSLNIVPELDTAQAIDVHSIFWNCHNLEHCFYDSRINYNKTNSVKLKQNYPEYFI